MGSKFALGRGTGKRRNVQGSGGVTPSTPPVPGYFAWYDPSDVSTLTVPVSNHVSQMNDKSGNGYHVSQAADANRPLTGTRTLNGLNVLEALPVITFLSAGLLTPVQPQPLTVFAVGKSDTAGAANRQLVGAFGGAPAIYQENAEWKIYAGSPIANPPPTVDTNSHTFTGIFNGITSNMYVDGVLQPFSSNNVGGSGLNPGANQYIALGCDNSGSAWDGSMGEVIYYPGAISNPNRLLVEAYLKAKWGTP